jgi:alpha-ribazole phosphatase
MSLVLVRHADVDVTKGICYGRLDVKVNAAAHAQLRAKLIADLHAATLPTPSAIFTSESSRCQMLADDLCIDLNLSPPQVDEGLLELNFGAWEGQAWDSIPLKALSKWGEDWQRESPPRGETYSQLKLRALACYERAKAVARANQRAVWLIGSAGALKAIWLHANSLPDTQFPTIQWAFGEARVLTAQE